MGEELSLSEVLDTNKLVIADSCVFINRLNYPRYFMGVLEYSNLNEGILDKLLFDYSQAIEIFSHPSIKTIPEVSAEIKRPIKSLTKMTRRIKLKGKISDSQRKLDDKLRLVEDIIARTCSYVHESELCLLDPRYETLVSILKTTNFAFGFKKDVGRWKEGVSRAKRNRAYHGPRVSNDTDERLAASRLYTFMYSDTTPVLISRDSGFMGLLKEGIGIMGSRCFFPYNSDFRELLELRGFKFYFGFIKFLLLSTLIMIKLKLIL